MSHDYHHEKFVNLTCKHVWYYLYACKLSYQWQQSSIIDGLFGLNLIQSNLLSREMLATLSLTSSFEHTLCY